MSSNAGDRVRSLKTALELARGAQPQNSLNDIAYFLREVAAQLAELNEHLQTVDLAVFGK